MNGKGYLRSLLLAVVATALALPAVQAADAPAPGTIVGIVTNAAKLPVAHATVTVTRVDGSGIRSTLSGSDGVYSFADLPPGNWAVSTQVDGFA